MKYAFTATRRSRRVRNGHFVVDNKIDLESEVAWIIHETGADKLTTYEPQSHASKSWRCRVIT